MPGASAQEWLREPKRRSRTDRGSARHQACGCAICVPSLAQNVVFAGKTTKPVPPRGLTNDFSCCFLCRQQMAKLVNNGQMANNRHRSSLLKPQMPDPTLHCRAIFVPGSARRLGCEGTGFSILARFYPAPYQIGDGLSTQQVRVVQIQPGFNSYWIVY